MELKVLMDAWEFRGFGNVLCPRIGKFTERVVVDTSREFYPFVAVRDERGTMLELFPCGDPVLLRKVMKDLSCREDFLHPFFTTLFFVKKISQ